MPAQEMYESYNSLLSLFLSLSLALLSLGSAGWEVKSKNALRFRQILSKTFSHLL